MRRLLFALAALLVTAPVCAQIQIRPLAPALRPYSACKLPGGPDLVEITPLVATNSTRTVQTMHGPKEVKLVDGARLMFSYPDTDFFANIKVEQLAAATASEGKENLISNFEKILAADDMTERNYALRPTLQGFEIYGLDRKMLAGNTLGIYTLFDNTTHVVTTFYFLNADPARRKFATLEEYAGMRDQFLARYTACVRAKLNAPPATTPVKPSTLVKPSAPAKRK